MSAEVNTGLSSPQGTAKPKVDTANNQRGSRSSSSGGRGPGVPLGAHGGGPAIHRGNSTHGPVGGRGGPRGGGRGSFGGRDGSQHRESGRGMSICSSQILQ